MDKSKEPQGSMDNVIALLNEADSSKRLEAIEICAKSKDPAMVTPLSGALDDENADVRKAAVWALIGLGTEGAADALITALQNEDPMVRWIAAWGLSEIGTVAALMPLKQLKKDRTVLMPLAGRILARVNNVLNRIVEPEGWEMLKKPFIKHTNKSVGKMAKLAIRKIKKRLQ